MATMLAMSAWLALLPAASAFANSSAGEQLANETANNTADVLLPCPLSSLFFRSWGLRTQEADVRLQSRVPVDLSVHWVNAWGVEQEGALVPRFESIGMKAKVGDAFRVYGLYPDRRLVLEHRVEERAGEIAVEGCAELNTSPEAVMGAVQRRAKEFEGLVQPESACAPAGHSSRWSCMRLTPRLACERRRPDLFGIDEREAERTPWRAGATEDFRADGQMAQIPALSRGPGFLRMRMPRRLVEVFKWYMEEREKSLEKRVKEDGDLLFGPTDRLSLDHYPAVKQVVVSELRDVLQWWTGLPVHHTVTYGVRVYRQGALLLNHVDRQATHLVSAILQLHQEVSGPDEGWPLEVLTEERDCFEVFLQPGEMLLYEGARLKHGRPMRFRGREFANIFTHFVPEGWRGIAREVQEL